MIAAAPMGDPNASIPTPQPVHYRPMFGAYGGAIAATSMTFVSGTSLAKGLAAALRVSKPLVAVENTRGGLRKSSMVHNSATPHLEIDPETYAVVADGILLTCAPAEVLPMAQRYFLFGGAPPPPAGGRWGRGEAEADEGTPTLCVEPLQFGLESEAPLCGLVVG